uniref:Uncharacterized protein n=1 Tax=Anguilla anguilla TaxID=7936 RepID=A0A0E9WSZ6_ANGAN
MCGFIQTRSFEVDVKQKTLLVHIGHGNKKVFHTHHIYIPFAFLLFLVGKQIIFGTVVMVKL